MIFEDRFQGRHAAVTGRASGLGQTRAALSTAIFDQVPHEHTDFAQSRIPMGRCGTIAEIAAMARFTTDFCFDPSERARNFVMSNTGDPLSENAGQLRAHDARDAFYARMRSFILEYAHAS